MRTVHIFVTILIFKLINTLKVLPHKLRNIEKKLTDESQMSNMMEYLSYPEQRLYRKSIDTLKLEKARQLYKVLMKDVGPERKNVLRKSEHQTTRDPNYNLRHEHASLAENELKHALVRKKSALYDRPYVESRGGNDYLVIRPDMLDPFVTVIPNAIYYATEKKCVNWLDDCSLQGIRSRLLRGVQWPYK